MTPEVKADLLPSLVQQGTHRGTLYAVGQYESGLALAGRRSLLLQAGIRVPRGASEPWTFGEFRAALAKLKALKATPFALDLKMNYGANEWYSYALAPLVQGFGGDLIDQSTYHKSSGTLDSPASAAALAFLRSLLKRDANGTAIIRPQTPVYPVMSIAFDTAVHSVLTNKADIPTALREAALRIDTNIAANQFK